MPGLSGTILTTLLRACGGASGEVEPLPPPELWSPLTESVSWGAPSSRALEAEAAALDPDGRRIWQLQGGALSVSALEDGWVLGRWEVDWGEVRVMALRPDGTLLAAADEAGVLVLWDTAAGVESERTRLDDLRTFGLGSSRFLAHELEVSVDEVRAYGVVASRGCTGPTDYSPSVRSVTLGEEGYHKEETLPDARPFTAGPLDETLRSALVTLGGEVRWLAAPEGSFWDVEQTPSGRWVLAHPLRRRFGIASPAQLVGPLEAGTATPGPPATGPLALSPDGRWLAVPSGGALAVYDLTTGTPRWLDVPPASRITNLAWSPDGGALAAVSGYAWGEDSGGYRTALIYQRSPEGVGASPSHTFPLQTIYRSESIRALAYHPTTGLFLSVDDGRDEALFRVDYEGEVTSLEGAGSPEDAAALVMSPGGGWVAWRVNEHWVELIDTEDFSRLVSVALPEDGDFLIAAGADEVGLFGERERLTVGLDDTKSTRAYKEKRGLKRLLRQHAAVAAAGLEREARMIRWGERGAPDYEADTVVVGADGTVAWVDGDGRVWVDTDDIAPARQLTGPAPAIERGWVSPDGARVALRERGSDEARIWEVSTGAALELTSEQTLREQGWRIDNVRHRGDEAVDLWTDLSGVVYVHDAAGGATRALLSVGE